MGGRLLLAALALVLALSGCVGVDVKGTGTGAFAHQLEKNGIEGSVRRVRCSVGSRSWSYLCTYSRGGGRMLTAFLVDESDQILSRSPEFDAETLSGPDDVDQWSAFARAAGAICARRNAVLHELSSAKNRRQLRQNLDVALAAERTASARLGRLSPPRSMADDFSKLLSAERLLVSFSAQGRIAMLRGNRAKLARLASFAEAQTGLFAYEARLLRLTECAPR